jgi:hypothetical protein
VVRCPEMQKPAGAGFLLPSCKELKLKDAQKLYEVLLFLLR